MIIDTVPYYHQELKDYSLVDWKTSKVRDVPEWAKDKKSWGDYPRAHRRDSSAERHLYYRIAKDLGPGNYADIGVWRGGSAAALANGLFDGGHKGTIYAVDFFDTSDGRGRSFGFPSTTLELYIKNKSLDRYVDLKVCKGHSVEIGKSIIKTEFNFVSIDGDHTYSGAKADTDNWAPKVKKGGLLAFNDVACLSVTKVMNELNSNEWSFLRQIFNTKVFKRI